MYIYTASKLICLSLYIIFYSKGNHQEWDAVVVSMVTIYVSLLHHLQLNSCCTHIKSVLKFHKSPLKGQNSVLSSCFCQYCSQQSAPNLQLRNAIHKAWIRQMPGARKWEHDAGAAVIQCHKASVSWWIIRCVASSYWKEGEKTLPNVFITNLHKRSWTCSSFLLRHS